MTEVKKSNSPKKKYQAPEIKTYGTVKDFTRTMSHGTAGDASAFPNNKMMCISAVSPLEEHQVLLADKHCQTAFQDLIKSNIQEGDIVLDLGCGSGIHSLMALKAGAKKVYAIEFNPIIEVAKEVIADNGFQNRVEFLMGDSLGLNLPEKVDVIISNLGFMGSLESLPDAYLRFLKPTGKLIPNSTQLHFSPATETEFYERMIEFWDTEKMGFNFSAFKRLATNHPFYFKLKEHLPHLPVMDLSPIDYTNPQPLYSWRHSLKIQTTETMNGWLGWYDFCFENKSFISTVPGSPLHPSLWSHIYLPLENSIELTSGDSIELELSMSNQLAPDGPIWRWKTIKNGELLFDQSTFRAMPLSDQILSKLTH